MGGATGTVTDWIDRLRDGDPEAARPLWHRYFARLVSLARGSLERMRARRSAADEEDVALSAFDSFCRAVERDRFPDLSDRGDLWRLLVAVTERKVIDLARKERAAKRGGGKVVSASALPGGADVAAREPTPELAALVAEECERLLARLGDEKLRAVAVLKLEGHSNEEVARRLDCAVRTVERKLGMIRSSWERELQR